MALSAETVPLGVPPRERFPGMFAGDFSPSLVGVAATRDGVPRECGAPPASKHTRSINAQRRLRGRWAKIKHPTEVARGLGRSAPKKIISENATLARAQGA